MPTPLSRVVIDLPLPRDECHQNARVGAFQRAKAVSADKKDGEIAAKGALGRRRPPMWTRCQLSLHFRFPNRRARDLLNYAAAAKAQLDGVVVAGIMADDKCTVLERVCGITWEVNKENVGYTATITPIAEERAA